MEATNERGQLNEVWFPRVVSPALFHGGGGGAPQQVAALEGVAATATQKPAAKRPRASRSQWPGPRPRT